jgi:HK97 gp10 family phage protein
MANAGITFKVQGLDLLGRQLAELRGKTAQKIIRSAVTAGARVIVLDARRRAPVRTGALRKSIESLRDKQNSGPGIEFRAVSVFKVPGVYANTKENVRKGRAGRTYLQDPPTFYWKFNELGTVRQPARPFIQPALSENIGRIIDVMRKKIEEGLAKVQGP